MSALGHEQTSRNVRLMSVIPLKADIYQRGLQVRLVPSADIDGLSPNRSSQKSPLERLCRSLDQANAEDNHA
jgi:hypothetical protein